MQPGFSNLEVTAGSTVHGPAESGRDSQPRDLLRSDQPHHRRPNLLKRWVARLRRKPYA